MKRSLILALMFLTAGFTIFSYGKNLKLVLPTSDVVDSQHPYVVTIRVSADIPTEDGTASATLKRAEAEMQNGSEISAGTDLDFRNAKRVEDENEKYRVLNLTIDAGPLAEGEYEGEISVELGDTEVSETFSMFRIPEEKPERFPFGTYAVRFGDKWRDNKTILSEIASVGINVIQQHMHTGVKHPEIWDVAARQGLTFMPSSTTIGNADLPNNGSLYARYSDGESRRRNQYCLNHPRTRRGAAKVFKKAVRDFKTHPAFSGYIYYGDDLKMDRKTEHGRVHLTGYCDYCQEDFRKKTDLEPPVTAKDKEGVISSDDLWTRWIRYRSEHIHGGFVRSMVAAKNKVDEGITVGLIHGWSEQPFIDLSRGIYAPLSHAATGVVSSYAYPNVRSPRMDFITHREMAKMGNREKDAWMLGLFGMNGSISTPWKIYQNYWNQLAAGYKMIGFFGWVDYQGSLRKADGVPERERKALEALSRCGEHKDWILPAAKYWQQPEIKHAVLYSFTTGAYNIQSGYPNKGHLENVMQFHRKALKQHVPMTFVSEEEIREGILDQFESLSLYDVRVMPEDVHDTIEKYAEAGGDVYHPRDMNVKVEGATKAAPETIVRLIDDRIDQAVTTDRPYVTVRNFHAGKADYHVLINNNTDRYWGIPFDYQNPEENYKHWDSVRNAAVEAEVSFRESDRWLFDLSTGQRVGNCDDGLELRLEPSWGRVLMGLPVKQVVLKVNGDGEVDQGETASFNLRMVSGEGEKVPAAFAAKVDVVSPSGRETRYSSFMGVRDGNGTFDLPMGVNAETGTWTIRLTGGFPRKTTEVNIAVKEGKSSGGFLRARSPR